jgi:manganese/iron transport system permease protein
MWAEFLDSWPLFKGAYSAGWLAGSLLAVWGVFLLVRNQVFLGAAASEMSALGVAIALVLGFSHPHHNRHGVHHGHDHGLDVAASWKEVIDGPAWASLLFAVATCLLAAWLKGRKQSREATTGWYFLLGASLSLLLVSQSPLGKEEVEQALSSSLLGARGSDLTLLVVVAVFTIILLVLRFHDFFLVATEPGYARACGLPLRSWTWALYLLTGLAIGLSMHVAGFLFTFGCLLLPAMMAKSICRTVAGQLLAAPLICLAFNFAAFVMANHWDFPPAQFAVGLMTVGLPFFGLRDRFSAPN